MNTYLADALRYPAEDWIPDVFYEDFQDARQWRRFFKAHFPDGVRSILDKGRDGWHRQDFQALYIACWTYKPVVKGSYMLRLDNDEVDDVRRAYKKKLSSRWTSHLHGPTEKGADASKGWRFLRGYHELLVQIEEAPDGTYLFLKCEGHPAISYAHMKSWNHKRKHGVGLDVNVDLLTLASNEDLHLGIKVRAAENYSPSYKNLMRQLGMGRVIKKRGEIIDTRTASGLMLDKMRSSARRDGSLWTWLEAELRGFGISIDEPFIENSTAQFRNRKLSTVFALVERFRVKAMQRLADGFWRDGFLVALHQARGDIAKITTQLMSDHLRLNHTTTRYYNEVVMVPEDVDYGLTKARRLLKLPKGT